MSKTFKKNRTKFDDDYLDYNDESNRNRDKQKWKIERRKQSRRDNMISDKFTIDLLLISIGFFNKFHLFMKLFIKFHLYYELINFYTEIN